MDPSARNAKYCPSDAVAVVPMRPLACASAVLLLLGLLAVAVPSATACWPPPSGNGVTTCSGTFPMPGASLTGGPFCVNTLCPGLTSSPGPALCMNVWGNGNNVFQPDICVPTIVLFEETAP